MIFVALLSAALAEGWDRPEEAVQAGICARLGLAPEKVLVEQVGLASVPENVSWTTEFSGAALWGTVQVELSATRSDGSSRNYRTWAKVSVLSPVPIADGAAQRGEEVRWHLEERPLESFYGGALPVNPQSAQKWRAKVTVREGDPLTSSKVERFPDALENSPVEIRVQRGALLVRAPGKLTEDARIGEPVEVLNLLNQQLLTGIYSADGSVRIGVLP